MTEEKLQFDVDDKHKTYYRHLGRSLKLKITE